MSAFLMVAVLTAPAQADTAPVLPIKAPVRAIVAPVIDISFGEADLNLGTKAHGLTLSRQRARAVAAVLRTSLPPSSFDFTVRGLSESHPAVPNTSERNRKINRRVVVVYQKR